MKKQEFRKNEERLRNLQNNFKRSNIWIIGVPKGEEEEQEIKNLFEHIMKENFLNLAKEINFPEVQETQSPKEVGSMEAHTKEHYPRLKIRIESWKHQEKRRALPTNEFPEVYQLISQKKPCRQKGDVKYPKSWKARTYIQDNSIQQTYHLEGKGR